MTAAELREAYNGNIEEVDLLIGSLAEARPEGFGFGDTPFHLFLCMANRRLRTDRYVLRQLNTAGLLFTFLFSNLTSKKQTRSDQIANSSLRMSKSERMPILCNLFEL